VIMASQPTTYDFSYWVLCQVDNQSLLKKGVGTPDPPRPPGQVLWGNGLAETHNYMVEGFVAMLHTSPSTKEGIKELTGNTIMVGEAVWKFSNEPDKLRW
jgi:hypothetical protein